MFDDSVHGSAGTPNEQCDALELGSPTFTAASSPSNRAGSARWGGSSTPVLNAFRLAQADGWWIGHLNFDVMRRYAEALGLVEVPNRRGTTGPDQLRPTRPLDSHPRSLSARYGLSAQPLHTDGAHQRQPPRFVVLSATEPSLTGTLLWQPPATPAWAALTQHGVFTVSTGTTRFLSTVDNGRFIRFDPGCMTAADSSARRLHARFAAASADAVVHSWIKPDTLVVIDNWRALHARAAITDASEQRVMQRIAYHHGTAA
jgi:hypothetical protein